MIGSRGIRIFIISSLIALGGAVLVQLFLVDDTIHLSHRSGFYDDGIDLRMWSRPGLEIRYTTDGSDPDMGSPLYGGKIRLEDPTDNPNVYSVRKDVSQFFYHSNQDENPFAVPAFNVDKCIPLKAAAFDAKGNKVSERQATYWIDFDGREGYDGMYMVSVATDPDNLFDYEDGIFTTGKLFDEYVSTVEEWNIYDHLPTNYQSTGPEWERVSHLTVFSPNGNLLIDTEAGLRIKGVFSRLNSQKSLKLYAREEYGGSDTFKAAIFDRPKGSHRLILFSGGQDLFIKNKDWLVQNIVRDAGLNMGTLKMVPAAVFLDGEYWGVYYITEDYTADYIDFYYGIDADNSIIFKKKDVCHGFEEDKELYYDVVYDFVRQYGAEGDLYDFIGTYYVDMDSFVDYFATQIYIANTDWPIDNYACWRARNTADAEYMDGKWRYLLFDVNIENVLVNPEAVNIKDVMDKDDLFAALMENPRFQQKFYDKLDELEREVFSWENVSSYVGPWRDMMEEPLKKSGRRFTGGEEKVDIDARIAEIQFFCENRGKIIKEQFQKIVDEYDCE